MNINPKSNLNAAAVPISPANYTSPATPLNLPLLVRTTLLSNTPNFDPKFYPKLQFKIHGDLSAVPRIEPWTTSETHCKRRLVYFQNLQQLPNILNIYFNIYPQGQQHNESHHDKNENGIHNDKDKRIVISCIFNELDQDYYITSVDILYLLEQLLNSRLTIDEKNRIRRNLQTLKPKTITKQNNFTFFNQIMGYSNPKPRNIEKNLKVFKWSSLNKALFIIMNKYSCDFYNILNINISKPPENKQKSKKHITIPQSSSSNIFNSNHIIPENSSLPTSSQNETSGGNNHSSRQLSLPNITSTSSNNITKNFIPASSSALAPQFYNKTRILSMGSTSTVPSTASNDNNLIASPMINSPMLFFPNNNTNSNHGNIHNLQHSTDVTDTSNTTDINTSFYYRTNNTNNSNNSIAPGNTTAVNSLPTDLMYTATTNPNLPMKTINNTTRTYNDSKINQRTETSSGTNNNGTSGADMQTFTEDYINNTSNNNNVNNLKTTATIPAPITLHPPSVHNATPITIGINDPLSIGIHSHNNTTGLHETVVLPMMNSNSAETSDTLMPAPSSSHQDQHYIQQVQQPAYSAHPQVQMHLQSQPQHVQYQDGMTHVDSLTFPNDLSNVDIVPTSNNGSTNNNNNNNNNIINTPNNGDGNYYYYYYLN